MHRLFSIVMIAILWATAAFAEIYSWTDNEGVRHFSTSPPEDAANVARYDEFPHDVQKDTAVAREYEQWVKQIQQKEKSDSSERKKRAKRRKSEEVQKSPKSKIRSSESHCRCTLQKKSQILQNTISFGNFIL